MEAGQAKDGDHQQRYDADDHDGHQHGGLKKKMKALARPRKKPKRLN